MNRTPPSWKRPVVALACLIVAAGAAPARGAAPGDSDASPLDIIELRSGSVVRGVIYELPGPRIDVRVQGGARFVERRDILSVRFAESRRASEVATSDGIVRSDGHKIDGEVQLLSGGQVVRVRIPGGSSVTLPRSQVLRIIRKGDKLSAAGRVYSRELGESIRAALDRAIATTDDSPTTAADERFLIDCGIFAIEPVREALTGGELGAEARESLARVDRVYRLKTTLSPGIVAYEKDTAQILATGSREEKENLLLFLFARHVGEVVPLALSLAMEETEDPVVRAYSIDFLRRMQRNHALIEVYGSSTGRTQLVTAIALGKNQILLGVPTLIQTLELPEVQVRALAARYLREFTSKSQRFRPDGAPEARRLAVARWRDWWIANEKNVIELGRRVLEDGKLQTPERRRARQLWQQAEVARSSGNTQLARRLLDESLTSDPTFFGAQLAMAVLLLVDLQEPRLARDMLQRMADQQRPDLLPEDRYWIQFYLGSSLGALGDDVGALAAYEECQLHDPGQIAGAVRLARAAFHLATGPAELPSERRHELLRRSLESYQRAIKLSGEARESLVTFTVADLPADEPVHFERRKHNRSVLEFRRLFRRRRFEYVLETAKIHSLLGEKAEAITALEKGVDELADFHGIDDLRPVEVKTRNLLAMLYEETDRGLDALRQYGYIQKHLDRDDEQSRLALERARAKRRNAAGN